jgi:hypothetical protein
MYHSQDLLLVMKSFLSEDSIQTAYPLLDNKSLSDVVHAWGQIPVTWNLPPYNYEFQGSIPDNEFLQWDLLWSFTEFDVMSLAQASGLTPEQAMEHFQRAKMLRIVYPDGTIGGSARQFLGLKVSEEFARAMLMHRTASAASGNGSSVIRVREGRENEESN